MISLNPSPLLLTLSGSSLLLLLSQAQNLQLGEWQQIQYTAATAIPKRFYHAGAFLSATNEYLVFGGSDSNNVLGDFYSISMTSLQSTLLATSTPLGGRYGMTCTSDLNDLYVHGGMTVSISTLNDFWRFNAQTRAWIQLARGPSARWFHCMEWDQSRNQLILFGGNLGATDYNDLWTYSKAANRWQQLTPVGSSIPPARQYHACAFNTQSSMFHVHGGWGLEYCQDLWQFDFISNSWSLIDAGNSNVQRYGHSMQYSKPLISLILIHGFDSITSSYTTTLYQYSFNNPFSGWTLILVSGSQMLPARFSFSTGFNPLNGEYFVFGGFDRIAPSFNDFWKIQIETPVVNLASSQSAATSAFSKTQISQLLSASAQLDNSISIGSSAAVKSEIVPSTQIGSSISTPTDKSETAPAFQLTNSISIGSSAAVKSEIVPSTQIGSSISTPTDKSETAPASQLTNSISIGSSAAVKSETALSFQMTNSISIGSITTVGYETAQIIQLSDQKSSTVNSQIKLLRISKTVTTIMVESSSSFFTMLQTNLYSMIALGCILLVISCFLCFVYRLWRQRRISKKSSTFPTATFKNSSSKSRATNQTASSFDFTPVTSTSMTYSSSTQLSNNSQFQTMSITLASKELGLSVPAYLHIEYRSCIRERQMLAQGGFGVVILADALDNGLKQFGDLVIVKKLKKPQLSDRDIKLFYQEISLMEYFKNEKYVAKLLGFSSDPFCLIMKYYEMGSLTQFLKSAPNRCKMHVISFSKDIASGLQAMHRKGVVHNDLKPDNVLLDMHNGQTFCVLSDLGISQVITPQILKVGQFQVAQIKGLSLVYAAPERIAIFRNKSLLHPALADRQVVFSWDLYSLGVIMFELLTAQKKLI